MTVSEASDVQTGYCPSKSRKFMLAMLPDVTNITFYLSLLESAFEQKSQNK
jgi:hypothetical protein